MGELFHGGSAAFVLAADELVRWLTAGRHEVASSCVVLSEVRTCLAAGGSVALFALLGRVVHLR